MPTKRAAGISTREDVLVHEQTPDQILVLPALTETGNLKDEETIIVEQVVDLLQESLVSPDADVLSHLE